MNRKNLVKTVIVAALMALALTSCAPDREAAISTRTVRVIGTAKLAERTTREVAATEKYVIDSVDTVMIDGKDIKNDLTPVGTVRDGQNNVTFVAEVTVPEKVTYTAEGKIGYVFDEWEVLEADEEEENGKEQAPAVDEKLLDEIEDWLEDNGLEESETLTDVPAAYLTYLVAEYDNGFYVDLDKAEAAEGDDGSKARPYTADAFAGLGYDDDELTLVILGKDAANFTRLMDAVNAMDGLEELKLKAEGASLKAVPSFSNLEEISLSGFTFTEPVEINSDATEYEFRGCTFEKPLTVTLALELEIKGGKADTVTVIGAESIEIEGLTLNTLDLSLMKSGEVELENVTGKIIMPESKDVEIEVETEEE